VDELIRKERANLICLRMCKALSHRRRSDSGVAELQKGDVIEEINQQPVTSVSDYKKIVGSLDRSSRKFYLSAAIGAVVPGFATAINVAVIVSKHRQHAIA